MMHWTERTILNLQLRAPKPKTGPDPFAIPGVTQRSGDLVFPASAKTVMTRVLHVAPMAMRGPTPAVLSVAEAREKLEAVAALPETMHDYQWNEAVKLVRRGGGHLWTSPGAGKTRMGLTAACAMTDDPIIYVTRACLRAQAARECEKWIRSDAATPLLLRPPSSRRANHRDELVEMALRARSRPVVIVGWEQLRDETFVEDTVVPLVDRVDPACIVFDETQFAKADAEVHDRHVDQGGNVVWSSHVPESVAGAALLAAEAIPLRIGLTATPGETDRGDLHGQLRLIEPHAWGRSHRRFYQRYCGAVQHPRAGEALANGRRIPPSLLTIDPDEGALGPTHTEEFWLRIKHVASRVPYDVTHGHLEPLVRRVEWVERADQTRPIQSFNARKRALAKKAGSGDRQAQAMLRELDYQEAAERVRAFAVEAVRVRRRLGNGKGILFTGRKKLADLQARQLERAGFRVYLVHGDVTDAEFESRMQAARNDPGPCVLVGTPDKLGTGHDLPSFRFTIFSMLPNRVGLIEQAERRADRVNRKDGHEVIYLIPRGSIIEDDLRRLKVRAKTVADVHKGSGIAELDKTFGGDKDRKAVLSRLAQLLTS